MNLDIGIVALYTQHPFAAEILFLACEREPTHSSTVVFNLELLDDKTCLSKFRFLKEDLYRLRRLLKIPNTIRCSPHHKTCPGIEALCILLRRLSYPNRLVDLQSEFRRSSSDLSAIINFMLNFIWTRFSHKLTDLNHPWYGMDQLQLFANAVRAKGAPLDRCFGFLDGTIRPICRPRDKKKAKQVYTGHKKTSALRYQTLVLPNGLISNIYGPVPARRHDSYMLKQSGLVEQLNQFKPFYIYADQGYALRDSIIVPFKGGDSLPPHKREFNRKMSRVRISVEWPYSKVTSLFAFIDFKKNQKLDLQPVSLYYFVACLFTNCHNCINGNSISNYFNIAPPTLEAYLAINL